MTIKILSLTSQKDPSPVNKTYKTDKDAKINFEKLREIFQTNFVINSKVKKIV